MKTKSFCLFALVACIGLSSCNPDPVEVPVEVPVENRVILDLDIQPNEWDYSEKNNNNYFSATFTVPQITKDIYNNGTIIVYREYDHGTSNAVQTILPYIRHKEYLKDEATSTWGFFTETVDYEYNIGSLTIYYTASDFDYELDTTFVPEAMHFRLVITW